MIVSNHISWLDVGVISAVFPSLFISKAEVRNWPVIGWLCSQHHTLFLRRGSRTHLRQIGEEITQSLDEGMNVVVFPEGTTTSGDHVLHFHTALIQPALKANKEIYPLAISYWDIPTATSETASSNVPGSVMLQRSQAPAYIEGISLMQSIFNLLTARALLVQVCIMPPLTTDNAHRSAAGETARTQIADAIRQPIL